MKRVLAALAVVALSAGCTTETWVHNAPDVWSLALTAPSDVPGTEQYLGGHLSLRDCQNAGIDWLNDRHSVDGMLQCRLNCRKMGEYDAPVCEAIETLAAPAG